MPEMGLEVQRKKFMKINMIKAVTMIIGPCKTCVNITSIQIEKIGIGKNVNDLCESHDGKQLGLSLTEVLQSL